MGAIPPQGSDFSNATGAEDSTGESVYRTGLLDGMLKNAVAFMNKFWEKIPQIGLDTERETLLIENGVKTSLQFLRDLHPYATRLDGSLNEEAQDSLVRAVYGLITIASEGDLNDEQRLLLDEMEAHIRSFLPDDLKQLDQYDDGYDVTV
jgi:hypothetical protein